MEAIERSQTLMNLNIRTPVLNDYRLQLDAVNDHLCFGAFYAFEASQNILQKSANETNEFTTQLFPSNPYSERIHRRVSDIIDFEESYLNQSAAMALQAGMEIVQSYFEKVRKFTAKFHNIEPANISAPEDELLLIQMTSRKCQFRKEIFDTIVYLRRRRNHCVHMLQTPTSEMEKFWKTDAETLNQFWKSQRTKLFDFNFLNEELISFRIQDGFAIMNLLRVCMSVIDSNIAINFSTQDIIADATKRVLLKSNHLRGDEERCIRKVKGLVMREYGKELDTDEHYRMIAVSVFI